MNYKIKTMNLNLVDTILEQTNAEAIIDEVKQRLEAEKMARQKFYALIDEDTKAEFVNGQILYHSPVKKEHNDVTKAVLKLLDTFVEIHELGYVGIEKIMVSLTRNDYEPDVCFFKQEKAKEFKKGQMLFPAPDLAVEVLSSNVKHDRVIKFNDYQEHGVLEYWIIDAEAAFVEQYLLINDKYELQLKATEGFIKSHAVQGFQIPIRAIFDKAINLQVLRQFFNTK